MKRLVATILAVIYLATSSAASISMHYCMGKAYNEKGAVKDKCGKCGMKKAKGCCADEVKVIKVQDNHLSADKHINFSPPVAILPVDYNIYHSGINAANTT